MDWPIITSITTVEEVFELHWRIWDEVLNGLIQNGVAQKPITPYHADCAFCEYMIANNLSCHCCLADWGTDEDGCPLNCTENPHYRIYSLGYNNEWTLEGIKRIRDIPRKKI